MLRVAELFSGTGCQTQGLKNVEIDHVCYTSEWEINAIISYDALHTDDGIDYSKDKTKSEILEELSEFTFSTDGKKPCNLQRVKESRLRQLYNAQQRNNNLGSVVDIKELPKVDMVIHSSPCQSFSVAGKQDGGEKNSETSSSLMWETVRLVRKSKPKFILWENVKNVLSKKHRPVFDEYLNELDNLGYNSYYKVLNAKDYGIPQNRERIFCFSVRKDLDIGFEFPNKIPLHVCMGDFMDKIVDEKFFLSRKMYEGFNTHNMKHREKGTGFIFKPKTKSDIANCIRANASLCPTDNTVIVGHSGSGGQKGFVYDPNGLSSCLTATDYKQPKQTYDRNYNLRRLTPIECWRLMGWKDEQFDRVEKVNSNTQLYKQAGNGIVISVLEEIFKKMIEFGYIK